MEIVGTFAFVVPANGGYFSAAKHRLDSEGYALAHEAEGETGEIQLWVKRLDQCQPYMHGTIALEA